MDLKRIIEDLLVGVAMLAFFYALFASAGMVRQSKLEEAAAERISPDELDYPVQVTIEWRQDELR